MSVAQLRIQWLFACTVALFPAQRVLAQWSGYLSTQDGGGLVGASAWAPMPDGYGYRVTWTVGPNNDVLNSWHYRYELSDELGPPQHRK